MPKRVRHPKSEVEKAVQYAEGVGWKVSKANGSSHAWGRIFCPLSTREGCKLSIWSTPKNAGNHARHIRNYIDSCPHREEQKVDDESK